MPLLLQVCQVPIYLYQVKLEQTGCTCGDGWQVYSQQKTLTRSVSLMVFVGFCEVFPMGTETTSPPNQLAAFVVVGGWSHFWAILQLGFWRYFATLRWLCLCLLRMWSWRLDSRIWSCLFKRCTKSRNAQNEGFIGEKYHDTRWLLRLYSPLAAKIFEGAIIGW